MADDKKGNTSEKRADQSKQSPVQPESAKKEQSKPAVDQPPAMEIKPAEVQPPAPAPAPAPPKSGMQFSEHDKTMLDSLTGRLESYCAAMKPGKPINGRVEGANQQKALFRLLDQILNLPGPLFTVAWTNFLATVRQHRQGAFGEKYAFRFFEHTKLEAAVVLNYRNLIHLAIHTADPQGRRQMLKMIDIGMVCQNMTPNQRLADAANKLYGYYHDPM